MPRLPKKLRGDFYSETTTNKLSGFTSTLISIPNIEVVQGLVEQWGSTSPFSSMPGFFRLLVIDRHGLLGYLSISTYNNTLGEAAANVLEQMRTTTRFLNPDYDEVVGLQVNYLTFENQQRRGERMSEGKPLETHSKKLPEGWKYDGKGRLHDNKGRYAKIPGKKKSKKK